MTELLLQILGCPNCGNEFNSKSRNCAICGVVLIATSFAQIFGYDHEGYELIESIRRWRQVLKTEPENANAHFALGIAYLNSQFRDSALDHFRKASILKPNAADIHFNLAVTLYNDGNLVPNSSEYAEMVKEIEVTLQLMPAFSGAVAFRHLINGDKLTSINTLHAIDEYRKAIKACADMAAIWNNIGICFDRIDHLEEALSSFRQAITINPSLAIAYSNLAYVMYKSANYDLGIELASTALLRMGGREIDNHRADAHNILALCLWKKNRKTEALDQITKAVTIAPNIPVYNQNLHLIESSR